MSSGWKYLKTGIIQIISLGLSYYTSLQRGMTLKKKSEKWGKINGLSNTGLSLCSETEKTDGRNKGAGVIMSDNDGCGWRLCHNPNNFPTREWQINKVQCLTVSSASGWSPHQLWSTASILLHYNIKKETRSFCYKAIELIKLGAIYSPSIRTTFYSR